MTTPIQRFSDTVNLPSAARGLSAAAESQEGALFQRLMEEQLQKNAPAGGEKTTQAGSSTGSGAQPAAGAAMTEAEKEKERKRLRNSCQEFEALFLQQMLKGMRSTVVKSDLIEEAPGRKIWESMLDEEYAKQMAKREEIGLAKMLYKELSRSLG
ncbi:hypothetical protein GTO89_01120 [Heliobacterium gestii]|uniref:Flagellar protein FlgJ N-terminal domain-containing protein n=1 Tax=Heliomicrobium gestii TaxID=2699 RepID=A0A845L9N0_HELGE|nr:rod-binding protein [Heliomicrobium gestii]MBM7865369.1 hypothetical protein [Heliomicrobium gestii]MZP41630.1 hypothetical protein [Heliomicrobium gestii]